MPTISLYSLTKSFSGPPVLDDISLEIEDGEFFFLLGPSGCGKSTLLRIIAGLEKPDAGDVQFDNRSVLQTPPNKRNIGMVFQQYALWPHMNVFQNVGYGLKVRNTPTLELTQKVTAALKMVQMEQFETRYPGQLSGGQQQRVALARALAFDPQIVLLDEPLSNLDAKLRVEVRNEIREIRKQISRTMIYVTHDQEDALKLADRVAIMNEGKVRQIGPPEDLYDNPVDLFVATFIGSANVLSGTFALKNGRPVMVIDSPSSLETEVVLSNPPPNATYGAKVSCMIRPEALSLESNDQPSLSGNVEDISFGGSFDTLIMRLPSGHSIKASQARNKNNAVQVGAPVQLHYDPANVVAFST